MTKQVWKTHEGGMHLVKAKASDVEEGTLVFRVALPGGDVHTLVMPPDGLSYKVEGGVLTFTSRADGGTVVRQYGSWLWVETVPFETPRERGAQIF